MLWLVATKGALTANLTVPLPRGFTIIIYLCIINCNSFFDSAFYITDSYLNRLVTVYGSIKEESIII
nr:MAG TPA: hypothetical protein [Caudoviricetes sp.]